MVAKVWVTIVWGSSTTVGGTIEIELPGEKSYPQRPLGAFNLTNPSLEVGGCLATRASPFTRAAGSVYMSDRTFSRIVFDSTNQVGANATYPWTWAAGDA